MWGALGYCRITWQAGREQVSGVMLRFELRSPWGESRQPTLENVKLYCTPIVNLFKKRGCSAHPPGREAG